MSGLRPHEFVGRHDRECIVPGCGRPDRSPLHVRVIGRPAPRPRRLTVSRWGALLALLAVAVVTLVGAPFDRLALPLLYLGVALHVTDDRAHGG